MSDSLPTLEFDPNRRLLLAGLLAAGAGQMVPWTSVSAASQVPAASPEFMALSRYLTQRDDLSASLGARMQAALQDLNNGFTAQAGTLWQWIGSNKVTLADLNVRLTADRPELADVPGQVMQTWYLGIAGSGVRARVVAYEYALNALTVSDKLRPPTYAYGMYGSWSSNPANLDL